MKPTHILVPIEWIDKTFDELSKIPTSVRREDSNGKMRILNQIKDMPSVDLSEEGIDKMIHKYTDKELCAHSIHTAYHQCAKDLLNTKP